MIRFFGVILSGVIAALLLLALAFVPRRLIRRGQDRLAARILERDGARSAYRLLTPAGKLIGAYRRVPGVLGMANDRLIFETSFDPPWILPMDRVRKISSGKVLASGRRLFRDEVIALENLEGARFEFQMPRASAYQWRRLLSEWAARQKAAEARTQ
jgi:hypothetical protein